MWSPPHWLSSQHTIRTFPFSLLGQVVVEKFLAAAIYECSNEISVVIFLYTFMWLILALWIINACQIHQDKGFQGQPQTFLHTSCIIDNLFTSGDTFSPVDLGLASLMVKALLSAFLAHMKTMIYPCRSQICLKTLPFFVYQSTNVIIFISPLPACSAYTPGKNSNLWMLLAFIVDNNALHSPK
jgi:hypothetical protein